MPQATIPILSCLCDYLSQFRGTIGAIGYNKAGGHCPQKCCTGDDDDSPSFWHRAVRQHLVSSGWRCFFRTSQACEFVILNYTECNENCVTRIINSIDFFSTVIIIFTISNGTDDPRLYEVYFQGRWHEIFQWLQPLPVSHWRQLLDFGAGTSTCIEFGCGHVMDIVSFCCFRGVVLVHVMDR